MIKYSLKFFRLENIKKKIFYVENIEKEFLIFIYSLQTNRVLERKTSLIDFFLYIGFKYDLKQFHVYNHFL